MKLKRIIWLIVNRIISHTKFREMFFREFPKIQDPSINEKLKASFSSKSSDIHQGIQQQDRADSGNPIFITARFRSGSTLLWNLFRQIETLHSYYEPLNNRKWFNKANRQDHTDESHIGVQDYWSEYDHLENVEALFSDEWTNKNLLMDQTSFDPCLRSYIESLIKQSPKRAVLQFNRVDFRLQWLRANFSNAKIIHLYRHPRDQWISVSDFSIPISLDLSGHDMAIYNLFYTLSWARDLTATFPFLDPQLGKHPYYYHYLLWRLSFNYGQTYSDLSISFEDLVTDTNNTLSRVFSCVRVEDIDLDALGNCIVKPKLGTWEVYADDAWYKSIETECDDLLYKYFS